MGGCVEGAAGVVNLSELLSPTTVVVTPRCMLRIIDPGDAEFVYSALSAPGFTDGLLQHRLTNSDEAIKVIQTLRDEWHTSSRFACAITDHESDFLGYINLMRRDELGLWSVGFWIMPQFWGQGY